MKSVAISDFDSEERKLVQVQALPPLLTVDRQALIVVKRIKLVLRNNNLKWESNTINFAAILNRCVWLSYIPRSNCTLYGYSNKYMEGTTMDDFELYDENEQFDEGRSLLFPNADDEEFEEELMDLLDKFDD